MTSRIDMMELEELKQEAIIIQNEMQDCIDRLTQIVAHPEIDDEAYWEAYLLEQIGENVSKANPYNTDIGDLISSIHKQIVGHVEDGGCECPECEEAF